MLLTTVWHTIVGEDADEYDDDDDDDDEEDDDGEILVSYCA